MDGRPDGCVRGALRRARGLGLFPVDELRRDTGYSTRIDACFDLLNALGESEDPEVLNQLQIGALAPMTDDARAVDGARARLSGRALAFFESQVREYTSVGEASARDATSRYVWPGADILDSGVRLSAFVALGSMRREGAAWLQAHGRAGMVRCSM